MIQTTTEQNICNPESQHDTNNDIYFQQASSFIANSPSSSSTTSLIANISLQRWNVVNSIISSKDFIEQNRTQSPLENPTVLHVACSIPFVPFDVIKNVLQIYGNQICLFEDDNGSLPIHLACSTPNVDPRIILLLLQSSPETSKLYLF